MSPRAMRSAVGDARRIVVKVGSSSLTKSGGGVDVERITQLVDVFADRVAAGSQVILVSSGAIATGFPMLGLGRRPRDLATQQASAVSYGQRSTLSIKEQRERLPIFGKRAELLSLIADATPPSVRSHSASVSELSSPSTIVPPSCRGARLR